MTFDDIRTGKIKLQPGDLCFSRGNGWFPKAIRVFAPGRVNHVFGVSQATGLYDYDIIEALATVKEHSFYRYDSKESEIVVFRCKRMNQQLAFNLVREVRKNKGEIYSPFRIGGQAIDKTLGWITRQDVNYFSRLFNFSFSNICSTLWACEFQKLGISFGESAESCDPLQMYKFVINSSDWEMIFFSDGFFKGE